jgi:prepilin-type N-terminal cleavage/methylation domain-containing protein
VEVWSRSNFNTDRRAPSSDLAGKAFRQSGLTLVEVLITLVLLGMVAAVALGGLRQIFEARIRLRPYLDLSQETTLVAGWFRQTIDALLADYDEGKHRFAGTAMQISGLTTSPLIGPPGTPTAFRWSLEYDAAGDVTILEYGERPAETMEIVRWIGRKGTFTYYGEDQKWHPNWPPLDADQSKSIPQLPQLVRLSGVMHDPEPMIVAAPRASPVPPQLPRGLFGNVLPGSN